MRRLAPRSAYAIAYDAPLTGDIDLEATLATLRPEQRAKGILFGDLVGAIGTRWEDVEPTLRAPPRLGRYLPFIDYDAGDYIRLMCAAVAIKHPEKPSREGARLLGRLSVDTFARSQLGTVVMAMIDGPGAILAKYPSIYASMVAGTPMTGHRTGERSFEITMARFAGLVETTLGSLEESVRHFGFMPMSEVAFPGADVRITLSW